MNTQSIEQKAIKDFREILQEVWERMPDDITLNDIFYSTQIEPHIIKALVRVRKETREEVCKEYVDALIWCSGSGDFQLEGKARKGWEKICVPLINKAKLTK